MPDETPVAPNPADGAGRLSLSVDSMRGIGGAAGLCACGSTCAGPSCFAEDDGE